MSTPASALPKAAQARLATLKAEAAPPTPPAGDPPAGESPAPPVSPPAAVSPPSPPAPVEGERVTLTRAEYDALQANAGRSTTAEGRAEMLRMQLQEQAHRLTELENSSKSGATAVSPPAGAADSFDNIDTSGISFTEDENTEYGESRAFIQKVVRLEVASVLKDILPKISSAVGEARRTAEGLATTVSRTEANSFKADLVKKVGRPLEQIFAHKHWEAYLDEVEPLSQAPMSALLAHAINNKNVEAASNIYKRYIDKYMSGEGNTEAIAGYAGAAPGGGGDGEGNKPPAAQATKLKLSDRRKANEDYRKGKITYAQLEEVNKKFLEADKAGNVDYNS